MVMAQIKGVQNHIFTKTCFFNSDNRNQSSNYQLVTLPNFEKFHPQTTEIQHFKVECFSTKMLKFQHDDVIISDVSEDFGIFFGMWNRLAMNYLCVKLCCDTTLIACNTCIFHVYFLYFSANRHRFQHNDIIIYDVTFTISLCVLFLLDFVDHYLCTKFCCSRLTNK